MGSAMLVVPMAALMPRSALAGLFTGSDRTQSTIWRAPSPKMLMGGSKEAKYDPSGTKTRSCGPHVLVDEPHEDISPFDVGHTVGLFDRRNALRYPELQASMRASPVVVLHIDAKDAIEMRTWRLGHE
jgi:hypothetical protein